MNPNGKYMVVRYWFAKGEAPIGNGSMVSYCGDDLEEAKRDLAKVVADFNDSVDIPCEEWKPGYQSDPDSLKWSDCAYLEDGTAAWVIHEDGFDKGEILEYDEVFKKWKHL